MGAFIYRMPAGIAGDVTRREHAKIEPQVMDATYPVPAFGVPVTMVGGEIRTMPLGSVYTDVYGFIVRPYPSQAESSEALAVATPDPTKICDILVSGYMTVLCVNGTPAKNDAVYFRNAAGTPAETIGQVEAETSADNTVLTGAVFMGAADADGNVEIRFNI